MGESADNYLLGAAVGEFSTLIPEWQLQPLNFVYLRKSSSIDFDERKFFCFLDLLFSYLTGSALNWQTRPVFIEKSLLFNKGMH